MDHFCCIYCASDTVKLAAATATSKTWRCLSCRRRFTIERDGDDWWLLIDNGPLGFGLQNLTALFGLSSADVLIAAYDNAVVENGPDAASERPPKLRCVFCGSSRLQQSELSETSKTWFCKKCSHQFTLERVDGDWRLLLDGDLVASEMMNVAAGVVMLEPDLIAAYERAKLPRSKPGQAKIPSAERPACEPAPDLDFLLSLGRNIPRRYAHLVPPESLLRESDVFWPSTSGQHLLADSIPDGREFILEIEEHVERLAQLLKVERARLDHSSESANRIDTVIRRNPKRWLSGERFRSLVAYAGETIRYHVPAHWVAEYNAEASYWEPYLRDAAGTLYNPWLDLYKGILEREGYSFALTVNIEIQSSPNWKLQRGSW